MNTPKLKNHANILLISIVLFFFSEIQIAQNMQQVWADEFNDSEIDRTMWAFEIGPTGGTLHYFTDSPNTAKIVDGKLQILAQEESYEGFNYTTALLKTENIYNFRYGRIEARIKLPHTTGFVPAFWLLPQNSQYGFWPWSGEIDVMEHPTNQDKIYGTCHTWQYSYFTGSMKPAGGNIQILDSETAFHIYAIEWTPDKIDFYVDDQKYYTYNNDYSGFKVWPFDQPFYILLAMSVGGGWVGPPDASTVFPGIMEVDYVRVYQELNDVQISGEEYLPRYTKSSLYTLPYIEGASYQWKVTGDAEIVAGQNTNIITVDWNTFSSIVEAEIISGSSTYKYEYPVIISNNILKNYGFEKGVTPWVQARPYPGDIDFTLVSEDPHNGNNCLNVDVRSQTTYAWDVQLSQRNLLFESSKQYSISFWAKAKTSGKKITAAIINSTTIELYVAKDFTLTDSWEKYDLSFAPSSTVLGQINIDMGGQLGSYYLDDFTISLPELNNDSNQITNADFSNGNDGWIFNSFSPAQASGEVINGEFAISISNAGANLWDIHLGQRNLSIEKDKEYVVTFDAYAAEPRDISALVGKNADPWTVYSGDQIFSFTTERKTYSYSFVMNDPTDNQARLGFDMGTSSVDLYFDNIVLSKGEIPTGIEIDNPELENSFQLYQNYPNPFNPTTTIKYSIPSSTVMLNSFQHLNNETPKQSLPDGRQVRGDNVNVALKVYDLLGNQVATLVNRNQMPGNYSVEFDGSKLSSGVYYYQIKIGKYIQAKKMLLLK